MKAQQPDRLCPIPGCNYRLDAHGKSFRCPTHGVFPESSTRSAADGIGPAPSIVTLIPLKKRRPRK